MQQTKEQTFARWGFYLLGMVLLALGLTLNTKTGLGASAIVSVPFTVSQTTGWDFGNLTLVVYCLFVAAQFVIRGKKRRWTDLLQIPLSIVFTRFLNIFGAVIPYKSGNLPADLALLVAAILLTGVGAAMTVDMQLIPNPGDGIVSAISQVSGRELGFCKNCFDLGCVSLSLIIGFASAIRWPVWALVPSSLWWGWGAPLQVLTPCAKQNWYRPPVWPDKSKKGLPPRQSLFCLGTVIRRAAARCFLPHNAPHQYGGCLRRGSRAVPPRCDRPVHTRIH